MSRASRPGHSRPTAVIAIAPDELSAEIVIEGQRQVVTGRAPRDTRRAALDAATGYAARIGRPVLVNARDANGFWHLVATPDGTVQAADQADPGQAPPPAAPPAPVPSAPGTPVSSAPPAPTPPPGPPAPRNPGAGGGGGRVLIIVGAAVLALVLLAGVGAVTFRYLSAPSAAGEEDEPGTVLDYPAPPGFGQEVVFSEELAPNAQPGVSRDGDLLAYVGSDERLNLFGTEGERLWAVDLPVDSEEFLGAPRFLTHADEAAVVMETTGALWFWPTGGGAPSSVELTEGTSPQYVGDSVLVRAEDDAFVPVDGELQQVDVPDGAAAMLADGERVLTAVLNGPWEWVVPDGESEEVHAQRPDDAGDMESVMTALREYVIVRWEPLQGEGTFLAVHDREDGSVIGGAEVDPADLEDVRHRSGPIGPGVVAYGPMVLDPETGEAAVVPGFAPEVAVGDLAFGELDGVIVAVDAQGEVSEAPSGAGTPLGLLGGNAIVVHEDHLYAIPYE